MTTETYLQTKLLFLPKENQFYSSRFRKVSEESTFCEQRSITCEEGITSFSLLRVAIRFHSGFLVYTTASSSAVKRVVFVNDNVSYILLRGRWCNIIAVNVHAPSEEMSDYSNDSFYEDLEQNFIICKRKFY
jgi:hypothetical protein